MIVESKRAEFMRKVEGRVSLAWNDAAAQAKRNLGGGGDLTGSVRVVRQGPMEARIGSDHPGAYAQETGAYITPTRRRALYFEGRFSMRARIPAKRWLSRTGKQWGRLVSTRLRGG